jgi:hypothetical protein
MRGIPSRLSVAQPGDFVTFDMDAIEYDNEAINIVKKVFFILLSPLLL